MVVTRLTGKGHFKPVSLAAYRSTRALRFSEIGVPEASSQDMASADQALVTKVPGTTKGRANLRIVTAITDSVPSITTAHELQRTPSAEDKHALDLLARAAEDGVDNLEVRVQALLTEEQLTDVLSTLVVTEAFRRDGDPAVFDALPPAAKPEDLGPIQ